MGASDQWGLQRASGDYSAGGCRADPPGGAGQVILRQAAVHRAAPVGTHAPTGSRYQWVMICRMVTDPGHWLRPRDGGLCHPGASATGQARHSVVERLNSVRAARSTKTGTKSRIGRFANSWCAVLTVSRTRSSATSGNLPTSLSTTSSSARASCSALPASIAASCQRSPVVSSARQPFVHGGGSFDSDAGEVGCRRDAVEGRPRRADCERLVLVEHVAVTVEQVHGSAEPCGLLGDGPDDGLEAEVVG